MSTLIFLLLKLARLAAFVLITWIFIAAFDMGFDFTGYELDKDYFEAQELRFKRHKSQLKLFEV